MIKGIKGYAVYSLSDPSSGELRYIGYTRNMCERLRHHCRYSKGNEHKSIWIRNLASRGLIPQLRPLCFVPDLEEAARVEIALISLHRAKGSRLTNISDGGEKPPKRTGKPHAQITRQRMREAWVRRKENGVSNGLKGRVRSPEERLRISQGKKGKPTTEETKAKLSATRKLKFAEGQYDTIYLRNNKGKFLKKGDLT